MDVLLVCERKVFLYACIHSGLCQRKFDKWCGKLGEASITWPLALWQE